MIYHWSHLPNAFFIDEVLASLKAHPERWGAAWDATWDVARRAARDVTWGTVWDATWDVPWDAAWDVPWDAAQDAARNAARSTITALIAYDDAGQFMKLPVEQLKAMHKLDPHPMYLLLQPAAVVFMGVEP